MYQSAIRFAGRTYRKVIPFSVRKWLHGSAFYKLLSGLEQKVLVKETTLPQKVQKKESPAPKDAPAVKRDMLSLVVPCYNVALYIDEFFESLMAQEGGLDDIEVICVDDGSTDETPQKLEYWASQRPDVIRVITQVNGGLSDARNTGMKAAVGDWISFPDPDDFFGKPYLNTVRGAVTVSHKKPLLAVCTKLVFYYEDTDVISDTHPLTSRFSKGVSHVSTDQMQGFIHLAANTCWIRTTAIAKHGFTFDGHGWGSFEDAHMINRLFMHEPERTVTFVEAAHYFYRKRQNATSLVDTAKTKKSYWLEQMENGYLDLINIGTKVHGKAPKYVQRTVLYEMMWRIHHVLRNPDAIEKVLTPKEVKRCHAAFESIMAGIEPETINSFNLARCYEEHKVALLARYKGERRNTHFLYLKSHDTKAGTMRFSWYVGGNDDFTPVALVNGRETPTIDLGARTMNFMGDTFFRERFFEVPISLGDRIEFQVEDQKTAIKYGGAWIGASASWLDLTNALRPLPPSQRDLAQEPEAQRLRELILSAEAQKKYHGCWILMDADVRADDNAEHLYRYLLSVDAADNAYFILEKSSKDWPRLEAEGFNLLEMRSDDHIMAQFNSSLVVSSHADHYVNWPMERPLYADLANWRSVFLQHGVTKDDLSAWINPKKFDAIITTGEMEHNSIISPDSRYSYTSKDVFLTGFPRHDRLLQRAKNTKADAVVIMPTWRRYLTDETGRVGNARKKVDGFMTSEFARNWKTIVSSKALRDATEEKGLKIVFAPHPNMAMYLEEFDVPEWVETIDVRRDVDYQTLLSRCALMLTDYSSVAFEAGYIKRPLVYFHFDAEKFFAGDHVYNKGYFSYADDGFGPVTKTASGAIRAACSVVRNGPKAVYSNRQKKFFAHRDGQCCERVYNVIKELDQTKN